MFTLQAIIKLCEDFGITVEQRDLPAGLRGFNHSYECRREIVLGRTQAYSGEEHSLLHELREQIEYTFQRKGYATANSQELEKRAEDFARYVRTQAFMEVSGDMFEATKDIKSGLVRFGAIVLMIGVGNGLCFCGPFLSQLRRRDD